MVNKSPIARSWDLGTSLLDVVLNRRGDFVAVTLGNGSVALVEAKTYADDIQTVKAHDGVSLSLVADSDDFAFLSGGDDGKIVLIEPGQEVPTPVIEVKGAWIDHVASASDGHRAYATGKKVVILNDDGSQKGEPLMLPTSVGGMAFSPNSKRLAVSHYNGASLFWVQSDDKTPDVLPWNGMHQKLIWSPDGKAVLTSLQDGALHGWTLPEKKEMQMQGYAVKIKSMAFTAKGKYLLTSGADKAIGWPFFGGGPWGKQPLQLGGSDGRFVSSVAPHPRDELAAVGYDDGMMVLAPFDGRMEIMLLPPSSDKGSKIVGMSWNADGDSLFIAQEKGTLSLVTLESVHNAVGR